MEYNIYEVANNALRIQIPADKLGRVLDIVEDMVTSIKDVEYRSKYESHICYDEEPFCTEGFIYSATLYTKPEHLDYILYLLKKHLEAISYLEALLTQEAISQYE